MLPFRRQDEDFAHDVALLSIDPTQMKIVANHVFSVTAVKFDLQRPRDGDGVFTCGFPMNAVALTTTSGAVATTWAVETLYNARHHGLPDATEVYHLDLAVNGGNSGGPVFALNNGHLIGMVLENHSASGGRAIVVVVPSHYITELLDRNHIAWHSAAAASEGHK
jgi:S1-C subfamily serine protease